MRKNKIAILLSILLILSMTACSDNRNETSTEIESAIVDIDSSELLVSKDKITNEEHEIIIEETTEPIPITTEVNIKMVGDNLIHSPLYKAALQEDGSYNFDNLFMPVKEDIENADISIINQETIFINDKNKLSGYPTFGSPTEVGDAIVNAGFDIVAHATNHTIDKNIQGIKDTITFWERNYPDIMYLGINSEPEDKDALLMEKNGIIFAFVNYTYGLNGLESWLKGNEHMVNLLSDEDIEDTLEYAEDNADLTVAVLHIGNEYVYKTTEYQQEQIDKFINNGADIVLCAHPHVLQPYEMRTTASGNKGLVYYSLGNFISNQTEIPRILGGMADIKVQKTVCGDKDTVEIIDYSMIPLVTHQESGYYTTYKLEDYTDELCKKHKLYNKGLSIEHLNQLYNEILNID